MNDLLVLAQANDLPPRWDGLIVQWQGWEYPLTAFVCPPPKREVCQRCGAPTTHRGFGAYSVNRGHVALRTSTTVDDLAEDAENRARLKSLGHKRPRLALMRLFAFRCHECHLDTVWDTDTDEMWVLDHTDYNDEGSEQPNV